MVFSMPYYTQINSDYKSRTYNRELFYNDPIWIQDSIDTSLSSSLSSSGLVSDSFSDDNSNRMQLEFMTQILNQIELKLKEEQIKIELNDYFWQYLSDKLNLIALLTNVNNCDEANFRNQLDFFQNLNKLLKCLSLIEVEFQKLNLETKSLIRICCLIYEEANSDNTTTLDSLIKTEHLVQFEQNVQKLLKFIPLLITNPIKTILNDLIKSNECYICDNLIDIGEILLKPNSNIEKLNLVDDPITQSYKCLIENLNALNFYTHDAFLEAYELASETGCEVDIISFACLNLSYYSMGQFELKKNLFENSFQFLYELKQFNADFNQMFSTDSFHTENTDNSRQEISFKASYFDQSWETINNNSKQENKWKFEPQVPTEADNRSQLDIINHKQQTVGNWKSKHTICTNFSLGKSPPDYMNDSNSIKNNWSTNKTDLKPIGAKPASMFTVSNRQYNQRLVNAKKNQQQQLQQQQQEQTVKNDFIESIWKHDADSSTYMSPFIAYNDDLIADLNKYTNQLNKPIRNMSSLNEQMLKNGKNHSSVPLQTQRAQMVKQMYLSQSYYNSKPTKTVYNSDVYTSLETSSFNTNIKYKKQYF